ncbi:MAG: hypothetical protein HC817_00070 [Saprospiraceae bacterium]|nr:hypothetical protein [Saprospiraceae bacterium]
MARLESNPVALIGQGTPVSAAELLTENDFDLLKVRPNEDYAQYDFVGKLDARLTKAIDMTFTGNYFSILDKVTPEQGRNPSAPTTFARSWQVFNSQNNPTRFADRMRTNLRFRHRLGNTEGGASSEKSSIQNAQYTLQVGYERSTQKNEDARHRDRLFDYGYIGQFDYNYIPTFGAVPDTIGGVFLGFRPIHNGYLRQFSRYTRAEVNPVLANFNNGITDVQSDAQFNVLNGLYQRDNLQRVWNFMKT